ncbi:MAG: hypothetical protein ABIS47_05690, partial [Acidimicrobiales bacterium]
LAVSALGVDGPRTGMAAAAVVAAVALGLTRRPAAALVAAALAAAATPALAAGPLALVAAAVAAALAVPWPRATGADGPARDGERPPPRSWGLPAEAARRASDDDGEGRVGPRGDGAAGAAVGPAPVDGGQGAGQVAVPAWVVGLAAVPAVAAALDVAAGRTPAAALAAAALVAAVAIPALADLGRSDRGGRAPLAAGPALALAAAAVILPDQLGWIGRPLPHWPLGAGLAALGAAVAILPLGRTRRGGASPVAGPARHDEPRSAGTAEPTPTETPPSPSAMGAGAAEETSRRDRRRSRRR